MENRISLEHAASAGEADQPTVDTRPATWRDFVYLAKPGIVFSNLITAFGGFWIAAKWQIDWLLMFYTIFGTALVMGSACVLNNYLDRDLDIKMQRTKKRASASGKVPPKVVLIYGLILGVIGLADLEFLVGSQLCALLGLLGMFVYVWVYTAWLKRTSVWNTVVGAVSGAMPPVIGYCAVTNTIDAGAAILFLILFLWQPPHFWALGIRRVEDYRTAGYKMLPVVKGIDTTKISILRYVVLLVPATLLLYHFGFVGEIYLIVAAISGLLWAFMSVQGFKTSDTEAWSKKMFIYSVNYLTFLFLIMVLDTNGFMSGWFGL